MFYFVYFKLYRWYHLEWQADVTSFQADVIQFKSDITYLHCDIT